MSTARIDELQNAVASGEWPAVLPLWESYAAVIHEEIVRGTCTAAHLSEAREFLDWAKRTALCARAQAQQQLNAIHAARQYDAPSAPQASSLRTSL